MSGIKGPPFDGSTPCPMCPVEIRELAAVAHNTVVQFEEIERHGMDAESTARLWRKLRELRDAVALAQSLADAHFADRMHSHGEVNQ